MANDKLVDSGKLDAALTATANAIRAKTGDTAQIAFDLSGQTGFKAAVEAITGGGSGGAYDILATIVGDTQSLAITDASGGSGIFHESGTIAFHTGTNDYNMYIPLSESYDNYIIIAKATKTWEKINDTWTERNGLDYAGIGFQSATYMLHGVTATTKKLETLNGINNDGGNFTGLGSFGLGERTSAKSGSNTGAITCNVCTVTDDVMTVSCGTTTFVCRDIVGLTYAYDIWGWND